MDRKKIILLVSALIIAALTAFMARSMFTGAAAPQTKAALPVPTGPEVLVATRALPVGTLITADSLRYQPWPKELIEEAYFIKDSGDTPKLEDLVGTVIRNPITAGQPITQGSVVAPGDRGFLAAALGPGMRAISVPVSALTGVSGFVFPGDRVDLFLTQNVEAPDGTAPLKVSETIIRNLRVLATDQRSQPKLDKDGNTIVSRYKLVTLEVTPRIAEQITVAQSIGTISLSLRSLAETAGELEQALALGSVNMPKGATADQEQEILKAAAQQPSSGRSSYATGGDVSRFQRRRLPTVIKPKVIVAKTELQQAVERVQIQKEVQKVQKIAKGPVVRVTKGGSTSEVELDRRN
jgi:pilus assembly protein CpaB